MPKQNRSKFASVSGARPRQSWVGWLLMAVTLGAAPPVGAAPPDCGGVSAVFNTSPDLVGELTTVRIASGLSQPVLVTAAPGDMDRLFVAEQLGTIRIISNGVLLATPFLDITALVRCCGEEGLLGLAFHPDYETNGWLFVYHTEVGGDNVVARYTVSGNPDLVDPQSRVEVLSVAHPDFGNHNGGMLAFGPLDGRLYVGTGDGGAGCDPGPGVGNAQSLASNLGKILRLDVEALPYGTAGNPYDGATPGNDEIWSSGLRNPWRGSFDRITGAIYIADVGQVVWEEIDCSPGTSTGGENYGWRPYEGDHCPNPSCGTLVSCSLPGHVPPIREYQHVGLLCAVMGGYVYRGCRMSDLAGTYFYSDLCDDDFLRSLRTDGSCSSSASLDRNLDLEPGGAVTIDSVVAFGEDNQGELYVVDYAGEIFKILPEISIVEVSGPSASPLLVGGSGSFTWEEFEPNTSFVSAYRVYRSENDPTGPFSCIHEGTTNTWAGGDPAVPPAGETFHYLITGQTASGAESTAGARSDGTLRTVDTGSSCPP